MMKRLVFASMVLAACVAALPSDGHAVQASGSILVVPSVNSGLMPNSTFTVDVWLNNSSSKTPGGPSAPVEATFKGPITFEYGCDGCECSSVTNFAIFEPGPASGCASKVAGVTGCAAASPPVPGSPGSPGKVSINLQAGGIVVPADGKTKIATLTFKSGPPPVPAGLKLAFEASTGTCAVTACEEVQNPNDPPPTLTHCADCAAQGCSLVQEPTTCIPCPHSCLSKIRDGFFEYHLMFNSLGDPSKHPFSIEITRGGSTISGPWTLSAIPGSPNTYQYKASIPPGGTGVAFVKASEQSSGNWKVDVQVRDAGLTPPPCGGLTTTLIIGGKTSVETHDWTSTAYGCSWQPCPENK